MIIASKHFPRIITGAVLVSVLGTALYLSGPYLFGLLLLFTLVGLWEFYAMFWPLKANIGGRILGLALGGLLITAAWMRPEMVVMTLALSTLILACMFLFCWSHDDKYRFTRVAVLAGGLLYVPMLIAPPEFSFTSNCCSSVRRRVRTRWPISSVCASASTKSGPKSVPRRASKAAPPGSPPAWSWRSVLASRSACPRTGISDYAPARPRARRHGPAWRFL